MIKKTSLIYPIFLFSFIILIFHFSATKLHLYWIVSWSDIISHTLGGIIFSLVFWFFAIKSKKITLISNPRFFTLIFAIFVGIFWEIFQIYFNISLPSSPNYLLSTTYDLFFDVFGAFLGYYYFINFKHDRS